MAFTRTWNAAYEASPDGTDDVSTADNRIRDFKLDIRERLNIDHYHDPAGTDADHGEHRRVTFHEPISTPSNVVNKAFLYGKDVSAKIELHFEDEDGNEVVLTTAGVIPKASVESLKDITATASEINTVADGSTAKNSHVHASGVNVLVYMSADMTDLSATEHDVEFDTEIADTGNDFNTTTYTFTAPATAPYLVTVMLQLQDLAIGRLYWAQIKTSNREYTSKVDIDAAADINDFNKNLSMVVDMDINDTLTINVKTFVGGQDFDVMSGSGAGEFASFLAVQQIV